MQLQKLILLFFSIIVSNSFFAQSISKGKDYALFFAISDYDSWSDLNNPISDAEVIAKDLSDFYGFETEVVINPTKEQILSKLDEYFDKQYSFDSQLFLFFTGHGVFIDRTKEGFFIPRNGKENDPFQDSYLAHTRLERIVDQIPCRHILLAIDACFSGTFDQRIALNKGRTLGKPRGGFNSIQGFISRQLKFKSRLYLTSGGKERTPDGANQSPFTRAFLEGLRSFGGEDGILTFNGLLSFMEKAFPLPRSGQFGDHKPGGNFLFITPERLSKLRDVESIMIGDTLLDIRNNKKYPTIILKDGKRWMAQNIDYEVDGSYCCGSPGIKKPNCYARHYSWEVAPSICPKEWHLPSPEEWSNLLKQYGGTDRLSNGEARLDIIQQGRGGPIHINGQALDNGVNLRGTDFYDYFLRSRTACTGKPNDRIGAYWSNTDERYPGKWVFSFFNEPFMDAPVYIQIALRNPNEIEEVNPYQAICIRCVKD